LAKTPIVKLEALEEPIRDQTIVQPFLDQPLFRNESPATAD